MGGICGRRDVRGWIREEGYERRDGRGGMGMEGCKRKGRERISSVHFQQAGSVRRRNG